MALTTLALASSLALSTLVSSASLPRPLSARDDDPNCLGKDQGVAFAYYSSYTYDVTCGTDFLGGDLRSFQTATLKECLAACDAEPSCVTISFTNDTCYLKNQDTSAVPNPGVSAAKKQNARPALSCLNKADEGKTYQTSKGLFKVICGREYAGGDLTSISTASFEACIEACSSNAQCVDLSYVNGACYLKQSISTLVDAGHVWTAQLIEAKTTKVAEELTCLSSKDNGRSYLAKAGGSYTVECGIDHAGGDLRSLDSTTFQTCMDTCDAERECVNVSWVWGTCYLKGTLTEGSTIDHVWTGRKSIAIVSSSAALLAPSVTSSIAAAETSSSTTSSSILLVSSSSTASVSAASSISMSASTSTSETVSASASTLSISSASSTSSTPTACPSSSTFTIGTIYERQAGVKTFLGRVKLVWWDYTGMTGFNPGQSYGAAGDPSVSRFTFDSEGLLVIANNRTLKAAVDSHSVSGVIWFGTAEEVARRSSRGNPGTFANCRRDRSQTPNVLICARPSLPNEIKLYKIGAWIYLRPTPYTGTGGYVVTLTVEDEVCT